MTIVCELEKHVLQICFCNLSAQLCRVMVWNTQILGVCGPYFCVSLCMFSKAKPIV